MFDWLDCIVPGGIAVGRVVKICPLKTRKTLKKDKKIFSAEDAEGAEKI
jgi:hypothetical protein